MDDNIIKKIAQSYDLEVDNLLGVEKGYRNESHPLKLKDGRLVNVIIYKQETGILDKIRLANGVANFLAVRGFPVRRTIDPRIIRLKAGPYVRYGALYNYLPGATIPWEAYTQEHLKLLGKWLSDMHAALANYPYKQLSDRPSVISEYTTIINSMDKYFSKRQVREAIETKLHLTLPPGLFPRLRRLLLACSHLPNQQTLHMDFVRSNVLFYKEKEHSITISGILDFEKASYGPRVFDLARTLSFLLVDCKYKPAAKVSKYFLHSGYAKRGKADIPNFMVKAWGSHIDVLESLVELFLFYDFYKFLKHNPYESLEHNEHFRRSCDLLITSRIISIR